MFIFFLFLHFCFSSFQGINEIVFVNIKRFRVTNIQYKDAIRILENGSKYNEMLKKSKFELNRVAVTTKSETRT